MNQQRVAPEQDLSVTRGIRNNKQLSGKGDERSRASSLASSQYNRAIRGLTQHQRMVVKALLPPPAYNRGSNRVGWSIYRQPTTINPPTILRLHRRDSRGKLVETISITENGIDVQ